MNYSVTTSFIYNIEDAWGFSSIASIATSGGFSGEILIGVRRTLP